MKKELQVIYETWIEDYDFQAFFSMSGQTISFLGGWSGNDASYRPEYMNPVFEKLGITVKSLPQKFHAKATQIVDESGICS